MLLLVAVLSCLVGQLNAYNAPVFSRVSPIYRDAFRHPLPIPAVKQPLTSYTNSSNGVAIDFYEIEVKNVKHKFYPNLPGSADLITYDGTYPGPTFRIEKGRQSVVRFINKGTQTMNVHLHGSYSMSIFLILVS
jgi:bilirubin oxidase